MLKVSGKAIDDPERSAMLWSAIAAAAGERAVVVVHGGGKQVDALLARLGEPVERIDGIRLTPPSQIGPIAGVLAGEVSLTLVGQLQKQGVRAVGLALGASGVLATRSDPRYGASGGRVGLAEPGEAPLVRLLIRGGYVPVISSIGIDAEGGLLNINADDAAGALARSLDTRVFLFVSDVPGVTDAAGAVLERIGAEEVELLIRNGTVTGGMAAKLRAAAVIARESSAEVVITSPDGAADFLGGGRCTGTRLLPAEVSA